MKGDDWSIWHSVNRGVLCAQWLTVEQNAFIIFIFYMIEEFLKHQQLVVVVTNHQKLPVPVFPNSEM